MELKHCPKCDRDLPLNMFGKNKSKKDGLQNYCKECRHKEYVDTKEKYDEYRKEYRKKDKDKKAEYQKKYRQENKEKILETKRKYRKKNRKIIAEKKRKYHQKRTKTDELYNFKNRIRHLVWQSFKRRKFEKKNLVVDIIGCTEKELKERLYKTFFDNYGYEYDGKEDVHIDHIVPLAKADTEEEVKRLCHYTNLQLLKAKDNLQKYCK